MDQSNLTLADSLYTIIYIKYPTFDPALRRLGAIRFQLGKIDEGLKLCQGCCKNKQISIQPSNFISLFVTTREIFKI